jgi:hypothetical protein
MKYEELLNHGIVCVCVVEISRQIPCCGARPEPENNQIVIIGKSGGGGGGGN